MNKQVRNRDKKIAILLIAAFAWLFIGSLIIFHQEHVLGKHFQLNSHLFISPKSKDKKDYSIDLHKNVLKILDENNSAANITGWEKPEDPRLSHTILYDAPALLHLHDAILGQVPLRAPPVA